jgi:8-amino-7-oxononanoate synthase
MIDLDQTAREALETLEEKGLLRRIRQTEIVEGMVVRREGRRLINFSSNDYLGLAHHPALTAAAGEAATAYGAGAGASRLVTGDHPLYARLERRIAEVKGTADAVVFGSGYLANVGTIPVLAGRGDLILVDKFAHACILDGAQISGADMLRFRHNDMAHLEDHLATHRARYRRCLIVTDGVFSMDGDLAPLPDIIVLARQYDAWVMTDDAHALGVVGIGKNCGRGSGFAFDPVARADVQMGTLSKAVGAYGGYVAGSQLLCDWLRNRARSLVYATGLPPGVVASAIAALDIITLDAGRVARPLTLARRLTDRLGLNTPDSAIVPLIIGDADAAVATAGRLEEQGFLVAAIRPPTVPQGTARLRVTLSAAHGEDQVDALAEALAGLELAG